MSDATGAQVDTDAAGEWYERWLLPNGSVVRAYEVDQ